MEQQQQTVVITGASAGVGRATAVAFAQRGWNVALIARGESGLADTCREIEAVGGAALPILADVADDNAVLAAADQVIARWGAINIWINNATVSVFSPVSKISPDEIRRVTEVTYLGYVFGTMAALRHMMKKNAGTIVQVGSALSYRAIPLQAAYCGSKFAIRGFSDSLRSELLHDRSSIRITMVQLPAVNTPQFDWSLNKMEKRPQPLPPIYRPEAAAEAIFRASQDAPRELWVGFPVVQAIVGTMIAPGWLDRILARKAYRGQMSADPRLPTDADNLFHPVNGGHAVHGRFISSSRESVRAINPAALRGIGLVALAALFFTAFLM